MSTTVKGLLPCGVCSVLSDKSGSSSPVDALIRPFACFSAAAALSTGLRG